MQHSTLSCWHTVVTNTCPQSHIYSTPQLLTAWAQREGSPPSMLGYCLNLEFVCKLAAINTVLVHVHTIWHCTMTSAQPQRTSPYTDELHWRMVYQCYGLNLTYRQTAKNLNVDVSTVCRVIDRYEETGDVGKKRSWSPLEANTYW